MLRSALLATEPGEVLSPSSVSQFLGCSARWYYRYVHKLPDPRTGGLLQGACVDQAVSENLRQKIETKRDLPPAAVQALYREAWAKMAPGTEFRDDEDPDELRAEGEALALLYLEQACPAVDPAGVQMPVSGRIGGVAVRGYIDVLDTSGRIIEIKTAKRSPGEAAPADHRFQVATYRRICPQASGEGRIDTLVKNKTPKLVRQCYTVDEPDLEAVERIYPVVQAAIRGGVCLPNRGSYLCSRRYCSFWRQCQRDFGGRVE